MKDGLLQRCTCFFECTARYVANLSAAVLKVFAFYLVLLCLFRFIYIARFYDFGDLSAVVAACVTGAKLSMKTAGILAFAGGAAKSAAARSAAENKCEVERIPECIFILFTAAWCPTAPLLLLYSYFSSSY